MPIQSPTTAELYSLPETLRIIEGTLIVPTTDDALAELAYDGLRYRTRIEFARQHPALALLYELNFEHLGTRVGSRLIDFRISIELRPRVRDELARAHAIALLSVTLALPGALEATITLHERLFPPVEAALRQDLPQCPPAIEFTMPVVVEAGTDPGPTAPAREFGRRSGSWDL